MKKFDILGVESCATIRQYMRYGDLTRKTYNNVDRAFYEPIKFEEPQRPTEPEHSVGLAISGHL